MKKDQPLIEIIGVSRADADWVRKHFLGYASTQTLKSVFVSLERRQPLGKRKDLNSDPEGEIRVICSRRREWLSIKKAIKQSFQHQTHAAACYEWDICWMRPMEKEII